MAKKRYKMVSINYTNECAKKPRCSFCYLKKAKVWSELKNGPRLRDVYRLGLPEDIRELVSKTEQVSIAYNGLRLYELQLIVRDCWMKKYPYTKPIINITTNPEFLDQCTIAFFKRCDVEMVALSLNSEKCRNLRNWLKWARFLRTQGIKVGANILMLDEIFSQVPDILKKIHKYCNQIHLLRPKFYKTKIPLKKRKEMIWLLKQKYKNLFIDECFKWEFTGEPCTRGKDFVSVNADGLLSLCSFEIYGPGKKKIKKCPFI